MNPHPPIDRETAAHHGATVHVAVTATMPPTIIR